MLLSIANGEGKLGVGISVVTASSRAEYSPYKKRRIVDLPRPMSPKTHVRPCLLSIVKRDL
jgi:hypothetical protein